MTNGAVRIKETFAFLSEILRHGVAISKWYRDELREISWGEIIPDEADAQYAAVFVVDMINDFCKPGGALYDPRIGAIVEPVVELLKEAHKRGVEKFILVQEGHPEDAKEFRVFPKHGVFGTEGADLVDEIKRLPFARKFAVFRKNAIGPHFAVQQLNGIGLLPLFGETLTEYMMRLNAHAIVDAGDCTDLCARELPMYQVYWANQFQKDLRIIVPENCVATFHNLDIPKPHPADVYHRLALYEMARHGIDVVKKIV